MYTQELLLFLAKKKLKNTQADGGKPIPRQMTSKERMKDHAPG